MALESCVRLKGGGWYLELDVLLVIENRYPRMDTPPPYRLKTVACPQIMPHQARAS